MKDIKIEVPKGFNIDSESSDLSKGIIKFKPCSESYKDVAIKLFEGKDIYCSDGDGDILDFTSTEYDCVFPNNSVSKGQIESILALNKLCNVAKYLNEGWLPDFNDSDSKWELCIDYRSDTLVATDVCFTRYSTPYFKTKELAEKAIEILGKDEVVKALTLNH
jgi:hypothetical protein